MNRPENAFGESGERPQVPTNIVSARSLCPKLARGCQVLDRKVSNICSVVKWEAEAREIYVSKGSMQYLLVVLKSSHFPVTTPGGSGPRSRQHQTSRMSVKPCTKQLCPIIHGIESGSSSIVGTSVLDTWEVHMRRTSWHATIACVRRGWQPNGVYRDAS